jgi:hypothetical protein
LMVIELLIFYRAVRDEIRGDLAAD